ncbi:MAG: hemerythrin domain-containing protein [Woeseiaceae bacterium]|nr:hemerythrin domain-containing protein [Woeseiaceae bacterium]
MTIFEALREDHERQRSLMTRLAETEGAEDTRDALFRELKAELAHHAASEEKYFYSELMAIEMTIDKARHSVAEHKELDDRVEELEATDYSSPQWLIRFKELQHRVAHHLEEEEREVFQLAGKALDEQQKTSLAEGYRADMEKRRQ